MIISRTPFRVSLFGGGTDFPRHGVVVTPEVGTAVMFDNVLADGRPDEDTLHAGLPVLEGEKWVATKWLREGRFD